MKFIVAPERRDWFLKRVGEQAADSLALEPGCRTFDVWADAERPGNVFLYEIYDDRAAFDMHLASAHFSAFDQEVRPVVTAKIVELFGEAVRLGA